MVCPNIVRLAGFVLISWAELVARPEFLLVFSVQKPMLASAETVFCLFFQLVRRDGAFWVCNGV